LFLSYLIITDNR